MSNYTKQQLFDALQALPPAIKEIVLSVERAEVFHEIMARNNLTVAQIGVVANELAPVTVGLVLPQELPIHLKRQLPELSDEQLKKLITDINELLLKEIREHVMALSHQPKSTPTPTPPAAPTSAVPAAPRTLGTDIAQAKMSGNTYLPSDTITVAAPIVPAPQASPQKPASPVQGRTYANGADPYREQIK